MKTSKRRTQRFAGALVTALVLGGLASFLVEKSMVGGQPGADEGVYTVVGSVELKILGLGPLRLSVEQFRVATFACFSVLSLVVAVLVDRMFSRRE